MSGGLDAWSQRGSRTRQCVRRHCDRLCAEPAHLAGRRGRLSPARLSLPRRRRGGFAVDLRALPCLLIRGRDAGGDARRSAVWCHCFGRAADLAGRTSVPARSAGAKARRGVGAGHRGGRDLACGRPYRALVRGLIHGALAVVNGPDGAGTASSRTRRPRPGRGPRTASR